MSPKEPVGLEGWRAYVQHKPECELSASGLYKDGEPRQLSIGHGPWHQASCTCQRDQVIEGLASLLQQRTTRPRVVCLCGSTRFIDQFATATWTLELQGHIVLGCTLLPAWFCGVRSHFAEAMGVKGQRDEHHLRKIDMADEVLVLNLGGYIGESTRNEIAYATAKGTPVKYVTDALVTDVCGAEHVVDIDWDNCIICDD